MFPVCPQKNGGWRRMAIISGHCAGLPRNRSGSPHPADGDSGQTSAC
ncbi:hypothetical protein ACNKHT_17075 [Shigella flexneri]